MSGAYLQIRFLFGVLTQSCVFRRFIRFGEKVGKRSSRLFCLCFVYEDSNKSGHIPVLRLGDLKMQSQSARMRHVSGAAAPAFLIEVHQVLQIERERVFEADRIADRSKRR